MNAAMTSPRHAKTAALERLLTLRRRRTQRAERELAIEQARCRDLEAEARRLVDERRRLEQIATRRDQARFDASQGRSLDATDIAEWQQSQAEDATRQATLEQRLRTCHQAWQIAHRRQQTSRGEWARRRRQQQALERLQDDHRRVATLDAERLAELESEESRSGRELTP
ncbi:YscO family type III secretion system apparatus protein [Salinicola rhizosphaerae]|uniref:Type III secretion protein n=1 Tax=Salinicola rhizosphaerae TaxID=1443141 RepID=A0ABQ3DU58_9GAMM|nr:YscO family type III secretion system apparatus protein [Salinicola rhizosphaerae]GHB11862.1 hypothetical protein GCM10009038_06840 [Salinicola rhizosphaerae]